MSNFEIKKDGTVLVFEPFSKNSISYFYLQFAKYALEKCIKKEHESISWMKQGRSSTAFQSRLKEINIVANYMGIGDFFYSLVGDGGFNYDQSILNGLKVGQLGPPNFGAYPPNESLHFLSSIGYDRVVISRPALQDMEGSGYWEIKITPNNITKKWVLD